MKPDPSKELSEIREIQADLRWKLHSIDRRIAELEARVAADALAKPEPSLPQPPPVPVAPIAPEPPAPAPTVQADAPAAEPLTVPPPLPVAEPTPAPVIPEVAESVSKSVSEPAPQTPPPPPSPPPRPTPPPLPKDSVEMQVGRVWLVRIGVVILLTGLVFLGNFAWQEIVTRMGPAAKLGLILAAGLALAALGRFLAKQRPSLRSYGNVLTGGGLAALYYAAYAAHFVEQLKVIQNPVVGGGILLGMAGVILWIAERVRMQSVAIATTAFAFYTSAINPVAGFSLFSNLILSLLAVVLMFRRRWISVSFVSLVGSYTAFAFWRFFHTGSLFPPAPDPGVFWAGFLFPACYWLVFTVAGFLGNTAGLNKSARSTFLTINNGAFFALAAPLVSGNHPDQLWLFTLGFGLLLVVLALIARRASPEESIFDGSYLAQGLFFVSLGFLFKFTGYQAALVFALQAAGLLSLGKGRHGVIFLSFSVLGAIIATVTALLSIAGNSAAALPAAAGVAGIFLLAAWLYKFQRGQLAVLSPRVIPGFFTALAFVLALVCVFQDPRQEFRLFAFISLGLLALGLLRLHRLPEVLYAGQVFFLAAFAQYFALGNFAWMPGTIFCLSALANVHWWQRQSVYPIRAGASLIWQGIHALSLAFVVVVWVAESLTGAVQIPVYAGAALLLLTHALLSRNTPLTVASQLLSLATCLSFVQRVSMDPRGGWLAASIFLFLLQSPVSKVLTGRLVHIPAAGGRIYRRVMESVAVLGVILAAFHALPMPWHCAFLSFLAFVVFLSSCFFAHPLLRVYAGVLAGAAAVDFLRDIVDGGPPFWANFVPPIFLLVAQQLGRHLRGPAQTLSMVAQATMAILGTLAFWMILGRAVAETHAGFLLTVSWAVWGSLVLALGFLLRERTWRLVGLGILLASVARIFIVDVWQLDTFPRILSFFVLGALLIAAGFLYNRFAEALRKLI